MPAAVRTVALFTDSYTPYVSGVVRSIVLTARELGRRGYPVVIVAPAYPPQEPGETEDPETGARLVCLPSAPAPGYPGFRLLLPIRPGQLARRLAAAGATILHAHSPFLAGRLALAVGRRMPGPDPPAQLFTHHTLYHDYAHYARLPPFLARPLVRRSVGAYCRRVDLVIAPTPAVARMFPGLYGPDLPPVAVVPTGLDLEALRFDDPGWLRRRLGLPTATTLLLYVGRLGEEKGLTRLLEAAEQLLHRAPGVHLALVGDGPLRRWAEARAARPPLAGRVHVLGAVPPGQVGRYYAGADLFITASTTETQGLVAVEAMAAGLPVVAPRAAGLADVVVSGEHGILVDTPAAADLAGAAEVLLAEPTRRRAMAEAARRHASRYHITRTTGELLAAYAAALARHHHHGRLTGQTGSHERPSTA